MILIFLYTLLGFATVFYYATVLVPFFDDNYKHSKGRFLIDIIFPFSGWIFLAIKKFKALK